ncbi:hypothetical protein HOP62_15025 [Halomonas sp. MCCC 1A17488]|uniref:Uncharacterized protein n=1 Tax=Billgrantia sulfidoxydans TaxID=2733484 RepID=A0ABX7W8W6_9GAMM|nr:MULTISPECIES: hypothetical protein [Halomonas]MCE8017389.1 hypothetical protein [Halomonas sp. MCCC 1A17488]MCG3240722.1 hypothetical protein [Halomonas sp. MCCC 1A17488]QPP49440.1 hypothetical protein I4484_20115 [Halomonas sp. SS10-MC5]QTP56798.1 hypothetical protein HNO51_20200 [Halomonas sulfidoxydans]
MRQFLFPRRPLSRGVLLFLHLFLQLGLLCAATLWLLPRTPWQAAIGWEQAWPDLAFGAGLWLAAAIVLRLLIELCLLPHHLTSRTGFAPGDVVTRSFERRPAVHDRQAAWTSEARPVETEPSVLGNARVTRPAEPLKPQGSV